MMVPPSTEGMTPSPEQKKKTRLTTATSDKASDMRRLVEYFVVVSTVPKEAEENDQVMGSPTVQSTVHYEEASADSNRDGVSQLTGDNEDDDWFFDLDFQPKITARYPIADWKNNPLHESVTFFCHPSGAIQMRPEQTMPKIHFFVLTGESGKQVYGTCLTLWEPYIISAKKKIGRIVKKEAFLPKCVVILSAYPYLMAFREFLTQLNRMSKMGSMTMPLERYIANFCSEIPAPPPAAFEVQTRILDSVIRIWSPPHNQPIAWVGLPFAHLFECLDIDNIITVWHCLALERQVLITSTQLSLLTSCCEILLSLLFPMHWAHAYIPVLPHFLVPILSAPMPFLCGIDKSNLASALCDLSRECVLVDLDMNLVTMGPDTAPLPPMPPQLEDQLGASLDDNIGMVFRGARGLTKADDYSDRGQHLPQHVKLMADAMWESRLCLFDEAFHLFFTPEETRKNLLNGNDTSGMENEGEASMVRIMTAAEKQNLRTQSQWDAVQESFVDAYVYLLRNYRKFLVFPSKDNEGSYGGAGFRSKEFVAQQRFDMQEFLQQLIGTQMFDHFVTKRLYGSGEADVAFFDLAVDRFLKTQGLLSNVDVGGRLRRASGTTDAHRRGSRFSLRKGASVPTVPVRNTKEEPLLQSARVHRKLKTIVPPEPSAEGLPPHPLQQQSQQNGGPIVTEYTEDTTADDLSVLSTGTEGTEGTAQSKQSKRSNTVSPNRAYKSIQDKAADILEKSKYRYTYDTFPTEFNMELFGEPRPLPSSVIEEFERQKKEAARFRRKKAVAQQEAGQLKRSDDQPEPQPSAEVATFTLFFMAFSAMVGKDLMDISDNPLLAQDKTILATYDHPGSVYDTESDYESVGGNSVPTTVESSTYEGSQVGANEEEFEDAVDEVQDDLDFKDSREELPSQPKDDYDSKVPKSDDTVGSEGSKPRSRFTQTLSKLQIEEAKAAGCAQLALAFEMLKMMKKRGLKTDPEAYQCLIDACGRVGDTRRATELLGRMHEDGIAADGVVYSCLVSAFSTESAWKGNDEKDEDLPEWANSTAVEMDWNKLQEKTFLDSAKESINALVGADEDEEGGDPSNAVQRLKSMWSRKTGTMPKVPKFEEKAIEFYVTEAVEMQIELGENLLEIVYPDISVDTDNETCPRCNFLLSDDDVVNGWTPNDSQEYTTKCPNCTQRFVPHFCVQSTSPTFMGSRGPASPLMCERLSPWVLQKEIRTVMADREGIENLLNPAWREQENKNAVLWWNLVLSCMRYRFPFSFLLQGSFDQNLISPMPEQD